MLITGFAKLNGQYVPHARLHGTFAASGYKRLRLTTVRAVAVPLLTNDLTVEVWNHCCESRSLYCRAAAGPSA